MSLAKKVVDTMYDSDWFSQWLGIERKKIADGRCVLTMKIRKEMLNGFGIAHGGIAYSLADSALAFASNSHGRKSVSIETTISHVKQLKEGDEIMAVAEEKNLSNKIGIYEITVTNQEDNIIALFKELFTGQVRIGLKTKNRTLINMIVMILKNHDLS